MGSWNTATKYDYSKSEILTKISHILAKDKDSIYTLNVWVFFVYVFVCERECLYPVTVEASSACNDVWEILRVWINDLILWVLY